jgi:hypothetical protein
MAVKINRLEIENVKRVKAVKIEPSDAGLTVIGGKNNQGKTSVLDAIAWSLGGDRFRPSEPAREGSMSQPYLHVELSNGLVVERKGKNSDLKVIDQAGNRSGQQLLNEFVGQLALDLPKFMQASSREKAQTLLNIIGVGDRLHELERSEKELYDQRRTIGQIADQKKKHAAEMLVYPEAPKELLSATDLIMKQQDILAKNGENQRKRGRKRQYEQEVAALEAEAAEIAKRLDAARQNLEIAAMDVLDLHDESTREIEESIADIEELNRKARVNMDKEKAESEAAEYNARYDDYTVEIERIRKEKMDLLNKADLPLPGLSVIEGELTYNGFKWDNLSGSDQLKVATAIVRKLNPDCGFVLIDKLEQMDLDTLDAFGAWLQQEGLQAIATRVSSGGECSIIIEDGYSSEAPANGQPSWKAGEF